MAPQVRSKAKLDSAASAARPDAIHGPRADELIDGNVKRPRFWFQWHQSKLLRSSGLEHTLTPHGKNTTLPNLMAGFGVLLELTLVEARLAGALPFTVAVLP